jgi:carbonic anhydrase
MKRFLCFCTLILCTQLTSAQPPGQRALEVLMEGNARFRTDRSLHPDRTSERRLEMTQSQAPFATIVGCSDSRVAPEILFDQGIGDLFIVRVAGNIVGPIEQDSIEYSVLYVHSSLVLVLGHENCGAVKAVLEGQTKDIEAVAELIQPAVEQSRSQSGNPLENAIKENVRFVVDQLKKSPVLKPLIAQKKLFVQGGYYNFHTGKVELLNSGKTL